MWAGAYERELVKLFRKALMPGMVILDVGANIGYFSVIAAGLVGKGGEVHAFEPEIACFGRLKKNLALLPWAHAHCIAVGDYSDSGSFHYSQKPGQTGWGSLMRGGDNVSAEKTLVSVTSLDIWSCEHAIHRVDFIKMDIEGGEYRALKGAESMLRQYRPVIVTELNEVCLRRDGRVPLDILSELHAAGYNTFSFNGGVLGIPQESSEQNDALADFTVQRL